MGRVLFAVALVLALAGRASAEIINGDFETGDFTGWDNATNGPSVSVQDFGGNYKAVIDFTNSQNGDVAYFQQLFTVDGTKAMLFSFDYQFSAFDISGPGVGVDYAMGANNPGNLSGTVFNGQSLELGPAKFSAILQPGANGMNFIIANNVGTASGQMIIDNVQLTPIPEPGSAALLSIGGAVAVLTVLRRKQRWRIAV